MLPRFPVESHPQQNVVARSLPPAYVCPVNDELAGAECATHPDPDLWFRDEDQAEAKLLCNRVCPAQRACLDFALRNPAVASDGVWGGKTAHARNRQRRFVTSAWNAA